VARPLLSSYAALTTGWKKSPSARPAECLTGEQGAQMKQLKRGLAVLGLACAFSATAAPIVVNGTIDWLGGNAVGNSIYAGFTTTEVDYIPFTIGGDLLYVDIDVRSYERSSSPPFAERDINGDGLIAYFDPTIYLFRNDGSLDLADFTGQASEFSFDTFADGSISFLDPYLRLGTVLAAGNYLLAIGSDDLSLQSALTGRNTTSIGPIGPGDTVAAFGAYQVTIAPIPEPASVALLGAGLAGMLAWRRRTRTAG
jgi:hypothetical protein